MNAGAAVAVGTFTRVDRSDGRRASSARSGARLEQALPVHAPPWITLGVAGAQLKRNRVDATTVGGVDPDTGEG